MKRLLAAVTLAFAVTAWGADAPGLRFSAFSIRPSKGDSTLGASVDYSWSKRFSASFGVSEETTPVTTFEDTPFSVPTTQFEDTHPLDFLLRYHHTNGSRVQPYAGAGVRYVRAGSQDHYRPEVNAGIRVLLTDHLGIEADWKHLYNQRNAMPFRRIYNGQFGEAGSNRLSVGLGWSF